MGTTHSRCPFHEPKIQKLRIVINLYLKSEFDVKLNLDYLKTNDSLKKNLRCIILTALSKGNYNVVMNDHNLWLVSKIDKNNIKYLELNADVELYECKPDDCKFSDSLIKMINMKLCILREFFIYTSNQRNIIISPDTTLGLLHKTLYTIMIQPMIQPMNHNKN